MKKYRYALHLFLLDELQINSKVLHAGIGYSPKDLYMGNFSEYARLYINKFNQEINKEDDTDRVRKIYY